jgi:hypothetical protein
VFTHSSCARENSSVFLSLCRKSFTEAGNLQKHEKTKQHQLRLMNGGGGDDFFFSNNNRQRQLTNFNEFDNNVDSNNSRKTMSMPTMHQIIHCKPISSRSRRSCAFGDFDIDVRAARARCRRSLACLLVFVSCAHESRFSAIDVESAFRSAIDWSSAQGVAHRGRFGSLFQAVRFVCVSVLLQLFASAADVRTHIVPITSDSSHSQSQ